MAKSPPLAPNAMVPRVPTLIRRKHHQRMLPPNLSVPSSPSSPSGYFASFAAHDFDSDARVHPGNTSKRRFHTASDPPPADSQRQYAAHKTTRANKTACSLSASKTPTQSRRSRLLQTPASSPIKKTSAAPSRPRVYPTCSPSHIGRPPSPATPNTSNAHPSTATPSGQTNPPAVADPTLRSPMESPSPRPHGRRL